MLDAQGVQKLAKLIHADYWGHIALPEYSDVVLKALELRLQTMHPKFQRILELRYLEDKTLAKTAFQISSEFGEGLSTSLSTVASIERRELAKLKDYANRVTGTGVNPESLDYSDKVKKRNYAIALEAKASVLSCVKVSAGSLEEAKLLGIKKALESKPRIWSIKSVDSVKVLS